MRAFLEAKYNKKTNIMFKLFKSKTLAICAIFLAAIIIPVSLTAQKSDMFFKNENEDIYDNRATEGFTLGNDPFGEKPVPVGSGLLVLTIAGAGYAVARRKRSLRKGTTLLLAFALILGLTQCKKRVETVVSDPNNMIHIALNVGNNSRHEIIPNEDGYVPVRYLVNDVVYVGNGTSYIGTLTCTVASDADGNNASFEGDIIAPNIDDVLHFYFVGGLTPSTTLEAGTTTDFTVDISNQSSNLPVLSYTTATYNGSNSISCNLHNKCALVEFVLDTKTGFPVKACNMLSEAKIDFANPGITPTGVVDAITLYPLSSDYTIKYKKKWAILLPGDARNSVARITTDSSTGEQYSYYDYDGVPNLSDCDYIYGDNAIAIHNNATPTTKNLFVVSDNGNVVQFAPGNLQYQASTQTWRFAEHPWDYVGNASNGTVYVDNVKCNNALVASDYAGWIDLFGWGCTGFADSYYGSTYYQPYNNEYATTEGENSKYGPAGVHSLTLQNKSDWGYVDIANSTEEGWRTLTYKEWNSIKKYHQSTNVRTYQGQISYDYQGTTHLINGLIILPDKVWDGGPFTPVGPSPNAWNYYQFTAQDWMNNYAAHGAVFLPNTYQRQGTTLKASGIYWIASTTLNWKADYLSISATNKLSVNNACIRSLGCMVRLAR